MDGTRLKVGDDAAMPAAGLGLWKIDAGQAASVVLEAAKVGYRHFDSACDYGNEAGTGEGLKKIFESGICRREEAWVTSKLWNTYHAREHVRPALERSLKDLGLDYLDLYLIHFPISLKYVPFDKRYPPGWVHDPREAKPRMEFAKVAIAETWGEMERLVKQGLVRAIGVCNFGTSLLRDLLSYASIRPAVLQVELHPYLTQEKLVRFCQEEGIAVTAFSPLGAGSYLSLKMAEQGESVLEERLVQEIAKGHGKSAAQVVLRWGVQRGTAVIPKTGQAARLKENISIFDFALAEEEMQAMSGLNRNRRFNDPGHFCEEAFGTFCPIYE